MKQQLYAHYFKNGKEHIVIITPNQQPVEGQFVKVAGKREARIVARIHNAICWNF